MVDLSTITEKINEQQRLDRDDLRYLLHTNELTQLGYLAHRRNQKINAHKVTYHEHCYLRCPTPESSQLAELTKKVMDQADKLITTATKEIRLVSIQPKNIPLLNLGRLIQTIKAQFPDRSIRALSAFHILQYSKLEKISYDELLRYFRDSGLNAFEGRDLKSQNLLQFHIEVRQGCVPKDLWFEIHRSAHQTGISSDATLSYDQYILGHHEEEQFEQIRQLQDLTGGFQSLIPLNPRLGLDQEQWQPRLSMQDLRIIATARLYLDNFETIRAPWGRMGINLAQLGLCFGANDLEGSLSNDNNSRVAGARPFRSMNRQEVKSLIKKSFLQPVEEQPPLPASQRSDTSILQRYEETERLLYKITKGSPLAAAEKSLICNSSELLALGMCATDIKKGIMNGHQVSLLRPQAIITVSDLHKPLSAILPEVGLKAATLIIDLTGLTETDEVGLKELEPLLLRAREEVPKLQVTVLGTKGLWNLSRLAGLDLQDLAALLKKWGVGVIESSSVEAEDDLTSSEISRFHQTLHKAGMATIGKIELAAPYHGRGKPFWDAFLQRIELYNQIQMSSQGLLGIKVESAHGANISPAEYLRAVALARIFLVEITNIITPLQEFPLFNEGKRRSSHYKYNTALKLAPLAAYFGSNDLFILRNQEQVESYCQILKYSGLNPIQRDVFFTAL